MAHIDEKTNELINNIETLTNIKAEKIDNVIKNHGLKMLLENTKIIEKDITPLQYKKLNILLQTATTLKEISFIQESKKMDSSKKVQEFCYNRLHNITDREHMEILFLNTQNELITCKRLFSGTVSESVIYIRTIIEQTLLFNATSIIVTHNHPGGSLIPSRADLNVTKKIQEALNHIDVKLLDHVIISPNGSYSFAEHSQI